MTPRGKTREKDCGSAPVLPVSTAAVTEASRTARRARMYDGTMHRATSGGNVLFQEHQNL